MKWMIPLLFLVSSAAPAADRPWWVLEDAEALFPVTVRAFPAVETAGEIRLRYAFGNAHPFVIKCDLEVAVDATNGDDVLTQSDYVDGQILKLHRNAERTLVLEKEDFPEGYHLTLGSLRVHGTCLGIADDTNPADVPAPQGQCDRSDGCLHTCQAADDDDGSQCASRALDWGGSRFLIPGEGAAAGPAVGLDLYGNGSDTQGAAYVGPKAGARVCAGRATAAYAKGDGAETDTHVLGRKFVRARRTALYLWTGGRQRAANGWALQGGGAEVYCAPVEPGADPTQLPDPEEAFKAGAAGAERFAAGAQAFTMGEDAKSHRSSPEAHRNPSQ